MDFVDDMVKHSVVVQRSAPDGTTVVVHAVARVFQRAQPSGKSFNFGFCPLHIFEESGGTLSRAKCRVVTALGAFAINQVWYQKRWFEDACVFTVTGPGVRSMPKANKVIASSSPRLVSTVTVICQQPAGGQKASQGIVSGVETTTFCAEVRSPHGFCGAVAYNVVNGSPQIVGFPFKEDTVDSSLGSNCSSKWRAASRLVKMRGKNKAVKRKHRAAFGDVFDNISSAIDNLKYELHRYSHFAVLSDLVKMAKEAAEYGTQGPNSLAFF